MGLGCPELLAGVGVGGLSWASEWYPECQAGGERGLQSLVDGSGGVPAWC